MPFVSQMLMVIPLEIHHGKLDGHGEKVRPHIGIERAIALGTFTWLMQAAAVSNTAILVAVLEFVLCPDCG